MQKATVIFFLFLSLFSFGEEETGKPTPHGNAKPGARGRSDGKGIPDGSFRPEGGVHPPTLGLEEGQLLCEEDAEKRQAPKKGLEKLSLEGLKRKNQALPANEKKTPADVEALRNQLFTCVESELYLYISQCLEKHYLEKVKSKDYLALTPENQAKQQELFLNEGYNLCFAARAKNLWIGAHKRILQR